jgi:hypothetical protein
MSAITNISSKEFFIMDRSNERGFGCLAIATAILALALLVFGYLGTYLIDRGNVDVLFSKSRREVVAKPIDPGWTWRNPVTERVTEYTVTNQSYEMVATLDPTTKEIKIAHMKSLSLDRLKREVDKCILVCSNCHRELEYNKVA